MHKSPMRERIALREEMGWEIVIRYDDNNMVRVVDTY